MPPKPALYVTALWVVAALVVTALIRGSGPETASEWLSPIGPGVAAALASLFVFDRWLWRSPGIRSLHGRPVLQGTWHGTLASDWIDATGNRIAPDPDVFLVVRQRFWHISARLLTKESSSSSLFAALEPASDGVCQLTYVYRNTPRADFRHRSELHYGAVVLGAPRDPAAGLEGHYFTDRSTRGDLTFRKRYDALAETHSAATRLT